MAAGPRRTKLVYSATPAGRRALRRWLSAPSAPPQFESEATVKFFFSDQATTDDARQALEELASHAETLREVFRAISASYADSPGPFPERLHIGAVTGRFVFDYANALGDWARWAREHVAEWPSTGPEAAALGEKVEQENARLAGVDYASQPGEAPGR